mmetsp:Transcript_5457/g.14778  ORF Transcript_5457/g.14778 Transcript_5457/m.14778 type:complete len:403 (-) Transcript_5457:204-1412(-)
MYSYTLTKMSGNVGERQIQPPADDDVRRIAVLAIAHVGGIVDGPLDNFVRGRDVADEADVILQRRLPQRQVLTDQHTDANTAQVEAIEEGVRFLHVRKEVILSRRSVRLRHVVAEFMRATRHLHEDLGMTLVNALHQLRKGLLLLDGFDLRVEFHELQQRLRVELLDQFDRLHLPHQRHAFQIMDAMRQPNGELPSQKAGNLHQHELRCGMFMRDGRIRGRFVINLLASSRLHQDLETDGGLRLMRMLIDEIADCGRDTFEGLVELQQSAGGGKASHAVWSQAGLGSCLCIMQAASRDKGAEARSSNQSEHGRCRRCPHHHHHHHDLFQGCGLFYLGSGKAQSVALSCAAIAIASVFVFVYVFVLASSGAITFRFRFVMTFQDTPTNHTPCVVLLPCACYGV